MQIWNIAAAAVLVMLPNDAAAGAGRSVIYEFDGQTYEGYYLSPRDRAPLVLLVHDWDGLTGYEIDRAGMIAGMGYAVFAADLFGAGVRPTEDADKRRHTGALYQDRVKLRRLLDAALEAAAAAGAATDQAVAAGYCFGGSAVLELARSGAALKGFAAFHGGLETPPGQDYSATKGEVLIMHGTADTAVTMDQFAALAAALEAARIPHEMVTYGGAPHAFTVFGSDRYREDADRKSWALFSRFLEETLQ